MPRDLPFADASNAIDIGQRYDIYATEGAHRVVVYRGAFFRATRELEKTRKYDLGSEYVEIEQSTGDSVFLRKYSILKFCAAGTKMTCELLPPGS
jgi:hypothetical protein